MSIEIKINNFIFFYISVFVNNFSYRKIHKIELNKFYFCYIRYCVYEQQRVSSRRSFDKYLSNPTLPVFVVDNTVIFMPSAVIIYNNNVISKYSLEATFYK
jgi:hypothetical protein